MQQSMRERETMVEKLLDLDMGEGQLVGLLKTDIFKNLKKTFHLLFKLDRIPKSRGWLQKFVNLQSQYIIILLINYNFDKF